MPVTSRTLSRMSKRIDALSEQLTRIEAKIDDLAAPTAKPKPATKARASSKKTS